MVVVDARGAERERTVGGAAVGVGEQRVVAHPGGEEPLGEPADEHAVEVETEPQRDVAHEDAVAEPADAPEVGAELELERAAEHRHAGRRLDRVEAGESGERGLDLLRRLALDLRPVDPPRLGREVVAHEPLGPGRQLAPARGRVDREVVGPAWRRSACRSRVAASAASKCSGWGSRSVTARSAASSNSCVRAWRSRRSCHWSGPRTISATRLIVSQRVPGTARPRWNTGADASRRITSWRW